MGREICPDSALFSLKTTKASSGEDSIAVEPEPITLAKQDAPRRDDFDLQFDADFDSAAFDTSFAEKAVPTQASAPTTEDKSFADFDVADFSLGEVVEQDEPKNNESIDFDLAKFSDLELESETRVSSDDSVDLHTPADKNDFDLDSFDFNTGFGATDKIQEDVETLAIDQFNLTEESADDKQGIDLAEDFNFDFDFSTLGNDDSDDGQMEISGVADLTDMDELETKLDLARAYRDMGDNESAKDIVSEVLEKGSAEQKKLAQVLLDELM
jgi:pilus assembly protein FimV